MFDKLLEEPLKALEYNKVTPVIYKARWSDSDVEHFIYFEQYESSKHLITARFGFRNSVSEAFSDCAIRSFGGELYANSRKREKYQCFMNLSFDRLVNSYPRWKLDMRDMTSDFIDQHLVRFVSEKLLPVVGHADNLTGLYRLLLEDDEPVPWGVTNTAIRAAQVIPIGVQVGKRETDITSALTPFKKEIDSNLFGQYRADEYIGILLDEAGHL